MKLNLKRAVVGLTMAVCLFSLSACSAAGKKANGIDADMKAQLEQIPVASYLELYTGLEDKDSAQMKKSLAKKDEVAALAEGIDSWNNVKGDLGGFISASDSLKLEESKDGFTATVNTVFEKRNMEFTVTFDHKLSKITGVAFVPEYSLGEKMEKAGFNTLMGMGTVFVVLIFISLLIGGFRYISIFEEKLLNKQKGSDTKAAVEAEPVFTEPLAEEDELKDDLELAAVITAAIAASEGVSPSGLVVRSIKRAAAGNWKKA
ncbi:OadG family protein [Lacrimispora defluvii]|uniref:OadG family protein n=1 Tax=Lacrimispora defluvii TaxID=2719233 RepID=A0ABX1VTW4_9FIRM|nr:OadG family protein [Lacrimispora defluvii]NNJ31857.1 OadG family protein [Lacrimispora defluvii]